MGDLSATAPLGKRINNEFKLILKTGNEIMETRNGIIYPQHFFCKMVHIRKESKIHSKTIIGMIQTGNGIVQTGNKIIYLTSRPLKKKYFTKFSHFSQGVQNWFSRQKMKLCKQEKNYCDTWPPHGFSV